MGRTKKVTIILPEDLLAKAQKTTGLGITPTIRQGLELVAAARAFERLRKLRGKVTFSIRLDELREDRS